MFHGCQDLIFCIRGIRVLLVQSNVDKVFCAGADLKERASMGPKQVSEFVQSLQSNFTALEVLHTPLEFTNDC